MSLPSPLTQHRQSSQQSPPVLPPTHVFLPTPLPSLPGQRSSSYSTSPNTTQDSDPPPPYADHEFYIFPAHCSDTSPPPPYPGHDVQPAPTPPADGAVLRTKNTR